MDFSFMQIDKLATPRNISAELHELDVSPHDEFVSFYQSYEGPFCSGQCGFELADIAVTDNQDGSIVLPTKILRDKLELPKRYLVISNLLANASLIYDCESNQVFNVDFEGGHLELLDGTLDPSFNSFAKFLSWYFDSPTKTA